MIYHCRYFHRCAVLRVSTTVTCSSSPKSWLKKYVFQKGSNWQVLCMSALHRSCVVIPQASQSSRCYFLLRGAGALFSTRGLKHNTSLWFAEIVFFFVLMSDISHHPTCSGDCKSRYLRLGNRWTLKWTDVAHYVFCVVQSPRWHILLYTCCWIFYDMQQNRSRRTDPSHFLMDDMSSYSSDLDLQFKRKKIPKKKRVKVFLGYCGEYCRGGSCVQQEGVDH